MIKHIVIFKFLQEAEGRTRKENVALAEARLIELGRKIDVIRGWQIGVNISKEDPEFDLVINSDFDSVTDLDTYRFHPAHLEFVEFIKPLREKRHVVDYKHE